MGPYVTPLVRAKAEEFALDLSTITGTGVGGRITIDDVYGAAPKAVRQARETRRAEGGVGRTGRSAAAATARLMQVRQSAFDGLGRAQVNIDAFALNPLIDDLKQYRPDWYDAAAKHDAHVPTMFESGGAVPLFTAAGYSPDMLLRLPWAIRHIAAATESGKEIADIFESCGNGTEAAVANAASRALAGANPGFAAYFNRVQRWLDARSYGTLSQPTTRVTLSESRKGTAGDAFDAWSPKPVSTQLPRNRS